MNRREFLRKTGIRLGAIIVTPQINITKILKTDLTGRVATTSVSVHSKPDDTSQIVAQKFRDELLNIYEEVNSPAGPGYNPRWFRIWNGYVHSAHVMIVRNQFNEVMKNIPDTGQLVEVTVPYSQTYHFDKRKGWRPLYRLYDGSLHWIVALEEGPDGQPWYRIRDELISSEYENYYAPAEHFRVVQPQEYSPLSPDVPMEKKWIEVDLSTQKMIAFEDGKEVLKTTISSGIPNRSNGSSWATPKGTYNVYSKLPSKHMGEGILTDDLEAYILPGVPWVTFFTKNGIGFHGTYWHNNFGMTMSHGCINMKTEEAKWVYRWTLPVAPPNKIEQVGFGTKVIVY